MNIDKKKFSLDYCVQSIQDWQMVAKDLLRHAGHLQVWCLEGELGVGKTMLVQALCRQLGVQEPITSPTFSLVQEYRLANATSIYHFDLYRVQQQEEILAMGWEHYLASGTYLFIEWPALCQPFVPLPYVAISIVVTTDNKRRLMAECITT